VGGHCRRTSLLKELGENLYQKKKDVKLKKTPSRAHGNKGIKKMLGREGEGRRMRKNVH